MPFGPVTRLGVAKWARIDRRLNRDKEALPWGLAAKGREYGRIVLYGECLNQVVLGRVARPSTIHVSSVQPQE